MIGSHLSIAGSMTNALDAAQALGLDCVQVFTKNQQQWSIKPLAAEEINRWSAARLAMGWAPGADGGRERAQRVVSHASYLINLASPDEVLRQKSIELMRVEIERCEALGIVPLVFHPGAHTTATRPEGIVRVADACARLLRETSGYAVTLCLENVAGAGSTLGRTLEELAELRARIIDAGGPGAPDRVGFCLDTCHAHAAGYDLSTAAGAREFLDRAEALLGAPAIRVLHLNDSKGAAGSRLDRHEHIGRGTIGLDGFAEVVGRASLGDIPRIMETPKEPDATGRDMDLVNAGLLRELAAGRRPVIERPANPPALARRTAGKARTLGPAKTATPAKKPTKARTKASKPGAGAGRRGRDTRS